MSDPFEQAIVDALAARTSYQGEVKLPAVPAALEHYVAMLAGLFARLGKPLAPHELSQVREPLAQNLQDGYREGGSTLVVVRYHVTDGPATLKKNLALSVGRSAPSLVQQYQGWADKPAGALFGAHPDARVMAEVDALADAQAAVLDVGAGSGRNTLPIARRGHAVDALEMSAEFCRLIEQALAAEKLPVRVIHGDVLDLAIEIPVGKYALAIASEVVSHFRYGPPLRLFLSRISDALSPGGRLLFNTFLPRDGYVPGALAREMSEVAWATLFTRAELEEALRDLPLRWIGDDSVYDYEKSRLPASAWPPTEWFEAWSRGWSIFPFTDGRPPPVELRWLLIERS